MPKKRRKNGSSNIGWSINGLRTSVVPRVAILTTAGLIFSSNGARDGTPWASEACQGRAAGAWTGMVQSSPAARTKPGIIHCCRIPRRVQRAIFMCVISFGFNRGIWRVPWAGQISNVDGTMTPGFRSQAQNYSPCGRAREGTGEKRGRHKMLWLRSERYT